MESNRDHVFEYKSGRLNMQDIGLDGPGSEALCLNFLMNGDCDILVPRDFRVGIRYFVEENASYREGLGTENGLN